MQFHLSHIILFDVGLLGSIATCFVNPKETPNIHCSIKSFNHDIGMTDNYESTSKKRGLKLFVCPNRLS